MEVASRLRFARLALGMNQLELSRSLTIHPSTWCAWELGENLPDPLVMARFGDLHGITTDWIYRGRTDALPPNIAIIVRALQRQDDDA